MAKLVQYLGNIWIWEASVAYRREVQRVLKLIRTTQAGQTLLRHISARPQQLFIEPYYPKKEAAANGWVNAYASASLVDSAPAGYVARSVKFNVPGFGEMEFPDLTSIGTGKGSVVNVFYHPAIFRQVIKNKDGHIAPGDGPGEILFHEMIHGYRMQCGLLRGRDQVADAEHTWDDVEEFFAIMAQNVYRTERGFTSLRKDHDGHRKLVGHLTSQSAYYDRYKDYIDKWFNEQRTFCLEMARCPSKFNPFREAAVELGLILGPATSMRL